MLLCVECNLYIEAAHYVLCVLPSGGVEEYASKEGRDVSGAAPGSESVYSGVRSDWAVCVI